MISFNWSRVCVCVHLPMDILVWKKKQISKHILLNYNHQVIVCTAHDFQAFCIFHVCMVDACTFAQINLVHCTCRRWTNGFFITSHFEMVVRITKHGYVFVSLDPNGPSSHGKLCLAIINHMRRYACGWEMYQLKFKRIFFSFFFCYKKHVK